MRSIAQMRDSPVLTKDSNCRREIKLGRRKGQINLPPEESFAVSIRCCNVSTQARSRYAPVSNSLLYLATASSNWDISELKTCSKIEYPTEVRKAIGFRAKTNK